jgi:signal transduction histidine kinase
VDEGLNIYYTDNGKGFDYNALIKVTHKGMGLYNIASRVNSIKGQFKINSQPNKGFHFELSVNSKLV